MTGASKAPANPPPEPSAFERMRELTRRVVAVPKGELPKKKERTKPKE